MNSLSIRGSIGNFLLCVNKRIITRYANGLCEKSLGGEWALGASEVARASSLLKRSAYPAQISLGVHRQQHPFSVPVRLELGMGFQEIV